MFRKTRVALGLNETPTTNNTLHTKIKNNYTNEVYEKSNKYFTFISERLKTELNLMDFDEYLRMKKEEAIARRAHLLESFKRSLDDFTLTKEEREIIEPTEDEIVKQEPVAICDQFHHFLFGKLESVPVGKTCDVSSYLFI